MVDNLRVKVDPSTGAVEVEGPEPFVREMLERFAPLIERAVQRGTGRRPTRRVSAGKATAKKEEPAAAKSKKARGGRVDVDEVLSRDLQKRRSDLDAYLGKRNLKSQMEEAAAVSGFLKSTLGRQTMNDTEYVTVLRIQGRRLPKNPRQVLLDAKNKKGFFHDQGESFALTTTGINFVDHDSLKKESSG